MAADRGRDLKVAILSDVDKFDVSAPADQLEALGAAAKTTGQDLDRLGSGVSGAGSDMDRLGADAKTAGDKLDTLGKDAKSGGDDLDRLGKDAKDVATKVDSAFDQIAKSSRSNISGGLKKSADDAKGSLSDVKDEAGETARETAASFDGTAESVTGAFQEVAANAFSTLGPVGAGLGLAAAAGLGFLTAGAEKMKAAVSDLAGALIDAGGVLDRGSILAKIKEFATDGSLADLTRQAQDAKIPVQDFIAAMAGDADALERSNEALRQNADSKEAMALTTFRGVQVESEFEQTVSAAQAALGQQTEMMDAAREAQENYAEGTGHAAQAQQALSDSLESFTDPLSVYTEQLADKEAAEQKTAEATAAATKDQTDSWQDYATKVDVSVSAYLTSLERQVVAQEQWSANLATLARRGVEGGVLAQLARMGPEGAPLVAKLTSASDAELRRLVTLYARKGADAGDQVAAGITAARAKVEAAAADLRETARFELQAGVTMPIYVDDSAARETFRQMERDFANSAGTRYRP